MDSLRAPSISTSTYFYAPLIISMIGIISSALALLIYHLVLTKYCLLRSNSSQTLNSIQRSTNQEAELPIGVDKTVLEKIPIISYNAIHKKGKLFRVDQTECAVCLGELEDKELVRLLPNCRHAFHVPCIDKWFVEHSSCPICRAPVTDIETRVMYLLDLLSEINLNGENVSSSTTTSTLQPHDVLRHCVSMIMSKERRSTTLPPQKIRRSLSMDFTNYNHEEDYSSLRSKSSKLLRSLSRLGRGKGNQIIPY
ncbi:RING-H2 finger protein ATL52-like [Capsicum annuum]|uniref:RING-H2 finger protein ATL52-like n=1 Tax=Capsicum annuum TaxID=4072 RepID=UPI0007BFB8CD|nr:RING-H2 finger protein ATL52-like [Capsicum annuum]